MMSVAFALLFVSLAAVAADPPSLVVISSDPATVIPISRPSLLFTESPPVLFSVPPLNTPDCPPIGPSGALAMYLSTGYVGLCVANLSALLPSAVGPLGFDVDTCTVPFSGESWRNFGPDNIPSNTDWYRNYHGIFSSIALDEDRRLAVLHGEDKNELNWMNDHLYQGTVNEDVSARDCFSGYQNGTFSDCERAYNAFVSGTVTLFTPASCYGLGLPGNNTAVDLGPLVWPVNGYLNASGAKVSYGVRQPGAVRSWDGASMLLFIDNGFTTADVWAARAAAPSPTDVPAFFLHALDGSGWNVPPLPSGFDVNDVSKSFNLPSPGASRSAKAFELPGSGAVNCAAARLRMGGAASPLHVVIYSLVNYTECWGRVAQSAQLSTEIGSETVRTLAARRTGSKLGARAAPKAPSDQCVPVSHIVLRVTADFVAYSDPVIVSAWDAPGWDASLLQYPVLLNAQGTAHDEVDAEGFFVLGTCSASDAPCGSTYGPQVTTAHVAIRVTSL